METPTHCTLCPRRCGADRTRTHGLCGGGGMVKIARAALHFWEEPCISGTQGSGTVFFSGCPLQCCYCQNHGISAGNFGREISTRRLADIFLELQEQGAHNINLVTAGHYLPWVCEALDMARPGLHIPVVYNTGGYETPEAVAALRGYVDIWLADVKYCSPELSAEYSNAPDYFEAARIAVKAMIAQAGPPVLDGQGLMRSGVILRHLALPGAAADTRAVLRFMAKELPPGSFLTSLMSQYTPFYKAKEHKALGRRISTYEYRKAVDYAVELGLTEGFMQEKAVQRRNTLPLSIWKACEGAGMEEKDSLAVYYGKISGRRPRAHRRRPCPWTGSSPGPGICAASRRCMFQTPGLRLMCFCFWTAARCARSAKNMRGWTASASRPWKSGCWRENGPSRRLPFPRA